MDQNNQVPTQPSYSQSNRPDSNSRHKRALPVMLAVLAGLILIGGGVSFFLLNEDSEEPAFGQSQQVTEPVVEKVEEAVEKLETTEYANEDYEFTFDYPKAWGEVEVQAIEGEAGSSILGGFSENRDVHFGAQSRDFVVFGSDGSCYVGLGVDVSRGLSDVDMKEYDDLLDLTEKGSDARLINAPLFSSDFVAINKHFEADLGLGGGIGACPGYSSRGAILFSEDAQTAGVGFFFGTRDNSSNGVPLEWAEDYLENPTYYYDAESLDYFVEMVKSTKAQ